MGQGQRADAVVGDVALDPLLGLGDLLANDRLRPVFLFEAVNTRRVRPAEMSADPELRTLRNLNTRDDYERALVEAGLA